MLWLTSINHLSKEDQELSPFVTVVIPNGIDKFHIDLMGCFSKFTELNTANNSHPAMWYVVI